jgi:hypothetical protein
MKAFRKLIDAIEDKMLEVGKDNIDYSAEKDDRFCYDCQTYVESENHLLNFTFDSYDLGTGFHVNNVKFDENIFLPNIIEKLNKTNFRYE